MRLRRKVLTIAAALAGVLGAGVPAASAQQALPVEALSPGGEQVIVPAKAAPSQAITLRWTAPADVHHQLLILRGGDNSKRTFLPADGAREMTLRLTENKYQWSVITTAGLPADCPPNASAYEDAHDAAYDPNTGQLTGPPLPPDHCSYAYKSTGCTSDQLRDDLAAYTGEPRVCSGQRVFSVVQGFTARTAASYVRRAARFHDRRFIDAKVVKAARVHCSPRNPLMYFCTIRAHRNPRVAEPHAYSLTGSGLVFYEDVPGVSKWGVRLRFTARVRCDFGSCTSKWQELTESLGFVCWLMPLPFSDEASKVDPRC